jgi:hypothetical protein
MLSAPVEKEKTVMSWPFEFTLPPRRDYPTALAAPVGAHRARHHILGRKYIQLLQLLAEKVGVNPGTLKRFAGWPEGSSSNKPVEGEFPGRFFWSPYNLFIGPEGQLRVFDPSSGVEQQKPNSFPQNRWDALKAIPPYFQEIGIDLRQLVGLEDGKTEKWDITPSPEAVLSGLTERIKAVTRTGPGDAFVLHAMRNADWAPVPATAVANAKITSYADIEALYRTFRDQINHTVDFEYAITCGAYQFLVVPPTAV